MSEPYVNCGKLAGVFIIGHILRYVAGVTHYIYALVFTVLFCLCYVVLDVGLLRHVCFATRPLYNGRAAYSGTGSELPMLQSNSLFTDSGAAVRQAAGKSLQAPRTITDAHHQLTANDPLPLPFSLPDKQPVVFVSSGLINQLAFQSTSIASISYQLQFGFSLSSLTPFLPVSTYLWPYGAR